MYINKTLNHSYLERISKSTDDVCDITAVEIKLNNNKKVNICAVYRPPNTNVEHFNQEIEGVIKFFKKKTLYLCGDFNINLLHCDVNAYTNFFSQPNVQLWA